jgi:hypothetical protein
VDDDQIKSNYYSEVEQLLKDTWVLQTEWWRIKFPANLDFSGKGHADSHGSRHVERELAGSLSSTTQSVASNLAIQTLPSAVRSGACTSTSRTRRQ